MSSSESVSSTILFSPFSQKDKAAFQSYGSLSVTVLLNFLLLLVFYNGTWAPPDDGTYAHLGERILSGEISNKDFQSIHLGLINFVNAASMWMFGPQLVSLRIPLIVIGLLQAIIVHILFSRSWPGWGIMASVSLTSLGIIQYFNPTAHWYCQVLFVAIIGVVYWTKPGKFGRLFILGYLIGGMFLFRQLSGVIGAIGLLTYLLMESTSPNGTLKKEFLFSQLLLSFMGVGLTAYFFSHGSISDFLLFGLCPIIFIVLSVIYGTCRNRETLRIVLQLSTGAFIAILPLFIYHLLHGSISPWISDTIVRAIQLSQLPVHFQREYGQFVGFSLHTLMNPSGVNSIINGTYLLSLSLLSVLNGSLLLVTFFRKITKGKLEEWIPPVLPLLAMFYAVVSIIYPILMYLYLSVGLSLLGVLWQLSTLKRFRTSGLILALFIPIVALVFHAGQPFGKSWAKFMNGEKIALSAVPDLEKLRLKIKPNEGKMYAQLVHFIRQHTAPNEPIFVFPNSPEIYFLADRPNPFRFYYLQLEITNSEEGLAFIDSLKEDPPTLIVFNPKDRNNTEVSLLIAQYVREDYVLIKTIGDFEVFLSSSLHHRIVKHVGQSRPLVIPIVSQMRSSRGGYARISRKEANDRLHNSI